MVLRISARARLCVNLPRWGLKQQINEQFVKFGRSVNLPRWGLKPASSPVIILFARFCVNLPRWGLKLC